MPNLSSQHLPLTLEIKRFSDFRRRRDPGLTSTNNSRLPIPNPRETATMQPTRLLQASAFRKLRLTTKDTNKGFYKGTGTGSTGHHTKYGGYVIDWNKVRTYVVPPLDGFKVRFPPFSLSLSMCPSIAKLLPHPLNPIGQ